MVPPIDGLDGVEYWTAREVTALNEVPSSVVVLGGGPVGIELAQFLRRFDAEVLVESAERLLARKDPAVSELLVETLRAEGIERLGVQAECVSKADGEVRVRLEDGEEVVGSHLLMATARRPHTSGLGLEKVGI